MNVLNNIGSTNLLLFFKNNDTVIDVTVVLAINKNYIPTFNFI